MSPAVSPAVSPAPSRSRRLAATLAAGAAATALAIVSPQPSSAAPDGLVDGGRPGPAGSIPVTLITGDRVLLATAADGTPSAVVQGDGDHYTRRYGDDLYVIPTEAQPALAADRLDLELFNVTGLVEQGYDDEQNESLPLIVEGAIPQTRGPATVQVQADLESIDATAVAVDKGDLGAVWSQLVGSTRRGAGSVDKIWLDARVQGSRVHLDPATGVEQTGAPKAWGHGYDGAGTTVAVLDTGYDAEHPDLAGQVTEARDFTGQGVDDTDGHGTHVAATVAGSGAADASKTGMAPGADLLIGKVLGWSGGQTSWIVAGMEWAVAQEADVVNMSLGSQQPTDCTDPMAQAAAALAEQSETLFVIAAGNSGARETVSSPGCVEGVLTVGALDGDGETAGFSSRGAVLGSHAVKPDIAAPGVGIMSAQAGSPGGIRYIAMSGTSMASPHVAGAAALVSQAHPDWTAQHVKAALVSQVKRSPEGTVYDQGSGELWTPDAIDAPVTSEASVELADFDWPHGPDERSTEQVTYTNDSDRPVRLRLDLEDVTGADGRRVSGHLIDLRDDRVTVPAHGTASVDVIARGDVHDLRDTAYGEIGGRIVATGSGRDHVRLTTAVGMWLEPETVTVTVKAIDRNGAAATSGNLDITDLHQPTRTLHFFTGEDITLRLRAGSYFISSFIRTTNDDGTFAYAQVADPDRRFTRDTTLTLDARSARKVDVTGDRPMKIRSGSFGVQRTWDRWVVGDSLFAERDPTFYATPSDRVETGDFIHGTFLRTFDPTVPTQESDYVYNLAFVEDDRVPADQSHDVSDRRLARVSERYYAQRQPWSSSEEWTRVVVDDGTGPFYSSSGDRVAAPGSRMAYYTPGIAWQQHASSGDFRTRPETWFDPVRTYRSGDHRTTEWFRLPTLTAMAVNRDGSPARIAERQGSLVGFAFPTWQDSREGRFAAGGFGDIGGLTLWQDGELVGHNPFPSGQADIGDGTTELTVQVTNERISRNQFWELGRGTVSRFTFRTSRPQGDAVAALPIALPRYDAPVDQLNLAPATANFPVSVSFHGQDGYDPGRIGSLTAKVSFDQIDPVGGIPLEDHTWTEVPVERRDGQWVALVDNSPAPGRVASLWITSEDAHGTRTEQFVVNLYGVQ